MSEFDNMARMDEEEENDAYGGGFDTVFGEEANDTAPKKRGRGRPKKNTILSKNGKIVTKEGPGVRKKIKREEDRRYHSYIKKVFKTIHPDMSIHPNTVDVINTCVYDVMTQICEAAAGMNARNNKKTMTASDIKFAIHTVFPQDIAKHAEQEGIMALARSEGENVDV